MASERAEGSSRAGWVLQQDLFASWVTLGKSLTSLSLSFFGFKVRLWHSAQGSCEELTETIHIKCPAHQQVVQDYCFVFPAFSRGYFWPRASISPWSVKHSPPGVMDKPSFPEPTFSCLNVMTTLPLKSIRAGFSLTFTVFHPKLELLNLLRVRFI